MAVFKDQSGRSAGTASLRRRGFVAAAVLVVFAVALAMYARGQFDSKFVVTIDANAVGDGLSSGSDVKFRGLSIGRVTEVETVDYGRQRMQVAIDPDQAGQLTDSMTARFTSSNVFGSTAIELISDGTGSPLQEDATLDIGADTSNITVTSVFRRLATLTTVLDSDQMQRVLDLMAHVSEEFGPNLKPFFDTARMMMENQRSPLAWKLHRGGELGEGIADFVPPTVDLVSDVVASSGYFADEVNRDRAKHAMSGLIDTLVVPIGDLLNKQTPDLTRLLSTLMDVLVPITASLGTLAPAYGDVPTVLQGIDDAFPVVDDGTSNGSVQLQLAVIVKSMPNLAAPVAAFAGVPGFGIPGLVIAGGAP